MLMLLLLGPLCASNVKSRGPGNAEASAVEGFQASSLQQDVGNPLMLQMLPPLGRPASQIYFWGVNIFNH